MLTITQDITLVAQWIASISTFPIEPIEPEVPAKPIQPGDPIPLDPVIPPVETMSLVAEEDGCVSTCTYAYDLAGNRTRFTLVLGETTVQDVSYTYDVLNRLLTVSENGELQATYAYDTNGNRAGLTYANGVVTTYTYNAANWVTSLQNTKNGETISGSTYTYYASGSQKSKTDHHGTVTTYVYDDLNRLVQESEAGGQTVSYAYDARGNRTQQTVTGSASYTVSYTYDAANRLTREQKTVATLTDTTTYTYDANGNLKSQLTVGASGTSAAAYRYDAYNRLISFTSGSQRTTYTYDPQGLRLSKQTGDTRTVFLSDGGNVAAEVVNGQLTATYLRGANLISRNEEYYLFNAHGDVVNLTSASGAVTRTYAYDAFGNEKNPDEADANPFRYCGEYFDSETGTYYLRARYYDPAVGRFTQQDTHWNVSNMIYGDNPQKISEREDALGLKTYTCAPQISAIMQSGNLYVYGVSNPIRYKDENGKWIHIAIGAFAGFITGGLVSAVNQAIEIKGGKRLSIDWTAVGINAAGGAVGGGLTAAGFGTVAAAVTSGCTNMADQLYSANGDFSQINLGSILKSAVVGAIGAKVGGSAGNTAHLNRMGNAFMKRITGALGGDLKSAGNEITKALSYYWSQATKDNLEMVNSVMKSIIPSLAEIGLVAGISMCKEERP